jgi:primary-amine oxidase
VDGGGLTEWNRVGHSPDNQDIFVSHTMNCHHLSRPEDWPVQRCVHAVFHCMPSGFFDANPAPGLPAQSAKESCCSWKGALSRGGRC